MSEAIQLYDTEGRRLYLTSAERDAFLDAATQADRPVRTLCAVLYYTGCRISEALALTPRRVDINDQTLIIESLKKRRRNVYRAVPVPGTLIDQLDMVHGIREAQRRRKDDILDARLWLVARNTAWRHVTAVMKAAGIPEGPHRCPKGLRHGYAIHALSKNVPLNMVSKCPSGWGIRRWRRLRSMPTPWARSNRASRPECGRDKGHGPSRKWSENRLIERPCRGLLCLRVMDKP